MNIWNKGWTVLNRDETKIGLTTGTTKRCTLEGCRGLRVAVRWPDGKLTWPCSRGLILTKTFGQYKII